MDAFEWKVLLHSIASYAEVDAIAVAGASPHQALLQNTPLVETSVDGFPTLEFSWLIWLLIIR